MKLKNPFKKSYSKEELEILSRFKKVNLFKKLSYEQIAHFLPFLHLRSFKEGEVIFFRKDPSHALYIIKEGLVSLNLDINDKLEVLTTLGNNNTVGDNCLLGSTRRVYSTIVESPTAEIFVLPQVNLMEVFEHHPKIKAKMMETMAERYNQFISDIFENYKASFGFFDLAQVYEKVSS